MTALVAVPAPVAHGAHGRPSPGLLVRLVIAALGVGLFLAAILTTAPDLLGGVWPHSSTAAGPSVTIGADGSAGSGCRSSVRTAEKNAADCTALTSFGGGAALTPGDQLTNRMDIRWSGSAQTTHIALLPGVCIQTDRSATARNVCERVRVDVEFGSTTVFRGTADQLGQVGTIMLPHAASSAAQTTPLIFHARLDQSADNTYQQATLSLPLTLTIAT